MNVKTNTSGMNLFPGFRRKGFLYLSVFFGLVFIFFIFQGCDDNGDDKPVPVTGTVTDRDGNTYVTVKIGNQWWMAEDLRVTTFASSDAIPQITDNEEWANTSQPAFCVYNNGAMGNGLLYNFYVIGSGQEIAPAGWHVPADEDWKALEEYLGMDANELDKNNWRGTDEGDQLKAESTSTSGWASYENVWGNNSTGFSAAGGSCRVFSGEWGFPQTGHTGFWWTSTSSDGYGWYRYLDYKKSGIFRYAGHPNYGFSIRCVKNN